MKACFSLLACFLIASCQNEGNEEGRTPDQFDPESAAKANENGPTVIIETDLGKIEAKLHPGTAPVTTENFIRYVEKGHFDGTIFHRVISNFMIQGGGFVLENDVPTEKEVEAPIKNESARSKKNVRGTLAMARTGDPDSATAQFFINVTDNPKLDHPKAQGSGYAVFGEVTKGMEVVDQIKEVPTSSSYVNARGADGRLRTSAFDDVPVKPVVIKSIRMVPED
jgi:cyclophilin family peptidyl-prolyl cis-trans isomerase